MKPNLFFAVVVFIMTVVKSAWAVESPQPAAALGRASLQSPKAAKMAILSVTRAGKRIIAAGERGIVLYSDDEGSKWTQVQTNTSASLTAMSFVNEKQGWAVGHMGIILHTTDGGQTWSKQLDGIAAAKLALDEAQKSGNERAIKDAELLVANGADKPFLDVYFDSATSGYVVGAFNLILRTKDAGATWQSWQGHLDNPRAFHLYSLRGVGDELFVAGEQGLLLHSNDNGNSFKQVSSPYKGSWFGLLATRNGGLLAYGLRGSAYLSGNKGKTWQKIETATQVSISAATELADGRIVIVSQAGQVLVSNDGGKSFAALPAMSGLPLAGVAEAADGLVLASLRGVQKLPFTH